MEHYKGMYDVGRHVCIRIWANTTKLRRMFLIWRPFYFWPAELYSYVVEQSLRISDVPATHVIN